MEIHKLEVHEAVEATLKVAGGNFLKLIRMSNACEQLNIEEEDFFSDFKLFVIEKKGKPIYSFREDSGAKYTTYITVVFRNWLYRKLQGSKKLKNEVLKEEIATSIKDSRETWEENYLRDEESSVIIESLKSCIDSLKTDSKILINEIVEKGMTIREISKATNQKSDKLYNQYYAALKILKKCLDSKGIKGIMVKS